MKYIRPLLDAIAPYRKSLVPVLVAGVLAGLAKAGVYGEMNVEEAVTLLMTGGLVWLIPNKA